MKYITKKGLEFLNERSKRRRTKRQKQEDDEASRQDPSDEDPIDKRIEAGRIEMFSKDPS